MGISKPLNHYCLMPDYLRRPRTDTYRFVVTSNELVYYGWKPKDLASLAGASISAGDLITLGWRDAAGVPGTAFRVISAKSPIPPRVQKIINKQADSKQQRAVSTFCGADAVKAAEGIGFNIVKSARGVTVSNNSRTVTIAVELKSGAYYLAPMNATDAAAYAGELGLKVGAQIKSAERSRSFSGASRPRPASMKKPLAGGKSANGFCSHNSIDSAQDAGWQIVKPEIEYE